MKEKQKKEIQSRREFFKSATKKALPILGAIALMSIPNITKAAITGCDYSCKTSCANDCYGHCKYGCKTTCSGSCSGSCKTSCSYSSK